MKERMFAAAWPYLAGVRFPKERSPAADRQVVALLNAVEQVRFGALPSLLAIAEAAQEYLELYSSDDDFPERSALRAALARVSGGARGDTTPDVGASVPAPRREP